MSELIKVLEVEDGAFQAEEEEVHINETIKNSIVQVSGSTNEDVSNKFLMENSLSNTSINCTDEYFCRICHLNSLTEPNISPCSCRGSMALVHKSCLEEWLATSDSDKCEICGFKYIVERKSKFSIFKALLVWITMAEYRRERLFIITDCIRFLTAFPMILLANHQTVTLVEMFQMEDVTLPDMFIPFVQSDVVFNDVALSAGRILTFFIVGAVSFLDMFYFALLFLKLQRHYAEWYTWYRSQCIVHLVVPKNNEENGM